MKINCFTCGKELDRFPSRLKANPTQFCDARCMGDYRARQVDVSCAVCGKVWQVKASRATQNAAITCSPACLGKLRSANIVAFRCSAQSRQATCAQCGTSFVRKPSQLAKYGESFCSRACSTLGKIGKESPNKNGEFVLCEVCGKPVWRTPATKRAHVFCSYACAGSLPAQRTERRSVYVAFTCEVCGKLFERNPSQAKGSKHCSAECRQVAFAASLRQANARRKGQPGTAWPEAQRAKLTTTLLAKYRAEWTEKARQQAETMTGAGNPQWQNGRSLIPYSPGFIRSLKRQIRKRDGNRCRICGSTETATNHLPIHHRDGGKTNHDPSNLIALCHHCHSLVHQGKAVCPP